jgi:CBS domain-containing membrane protein
MTKTSLKKILHRVVELLGLELNVVSVKEKAIAGLGGIVAMLLLIWISSHSLGVPQATALVGSMGASAVLLFGVPHGQLSQPWPLVMGHVLSAFIGVTCAKFVPSPGLAGALAVGLSIAAMHHFKCIHPPGGATALTAVFGGAAIHAAGYGFVVFPVLINAVVITATGVVFNYPFPWRRYPAALNRRNPPAQGKPAIHDDSAPTHEEIVAAVQSLDSFVDITESDLLRLIEILGYSRAV